MGCFIWAVALGFAWVLAYIPGIGPLLSLGAIAGAFWMTWKPGKGKPKVGESSPVKYVSSTPPVVRIVKPAPSVRAIVTKPAPVRRPRQDQRVDIRGMSYRQLPKSVGSLRRFQLVREPSNEHDRNAIAVFGGRSRVGYVPREVAYTYAAAMDQDHQTRLTVRGRLETEYDGWVILPADLEDVPDRPAPRTPVPLGTPVEPWGRLEQRVEVDAIEPHDELWDTIFDARGIDAPFEARALRRVDAIIAMPVTGRGRAGVYVDGHQVGALPDSESREFTPALKELARSDKTLGVQLDAWVGRSIYVHVRLPDPDLVFPPGPLPDDAHILLPRGGKIQVTGEERYLNEVSALLKGEPEQPVVAELYRLTKSGARTEKTVVGVRVYGEPVGELTAVSSAHFLPLLEACDEEGVKVVCRGVVKGNQLKADVTLEVAKGGDLTDEWLQEHLYGPLHVAHVKSVQAPGHEDMWTDEKPQAVAMPIFDQLEDLAHRRGAGELSEDEYQAAKAELMRKM